MQFFPQREHNVSPLQILLVNAVKEIIIVYSENHTKHINTLCGQNAEVLNVKVGGTYNYHSALKS
jgi:hypothetical protein